MSSCKEISKHKTITTENVEESEKRTQSDHETLITSFFKQRKSSRKTEKQIQTDKILNIEQSIREKREDGVEARWIDTKGRGAFATKNFSRGDFVLEYAGDLIGTHRAQYLERVYSFQDESGSSYMFYFKHKGENLCVDATEDTGRYGRLVNHSRNSNLITRTMVVDGTPRLLLFVSKCEIVCGTELTLDYGDRSKKSLKAHPWLLA